MTPALCSSTSAPPQLGTPAPWPRILVTGGAGFIGANLVRMLLDHGYRVTVLDNLSTGRREYLEGLPIEFVEGDILDAELVNRVVSGHDSIVHLAAHTGVPGSLADPKRDCEVNVIGTLNLLEACRLVRRSRGAEEFFLAPPHLCSPALFSPRPMRPWVGKAHQPLRTRPLCRFLFMEPASWLARVIAWPITARGGWEQWPCGSPTCTARIRRTRTVWWPGSSKMSQPRAA